MKINLESNFKLLGSHSIDVVDFDCTRMPVKDFLKIMSDRSTKTPEYLNEGGTDLAGLFQVQVNGRTLAFCENGINTVLQDGDTVAIYSNTHDG
jgi:hypothetical protein